jgi:hypothetical protein
VIQKEIAKRRLVNQRLIGTPFERPEEAVYWLGAVQAPDYGGAKWALSQSTKDNNDQEIDTAFNSGTILCTHLMRPT